MYHHALWLGYYKSLKYEYRETVARYGRLKCRLRSAASRPCPLPIAQHVVL
jgi:hypothetical protein